MSEKKPPKSRADYRRDYQREVRAKKVTVSFLTDPERKEEMKQMASDHGFASIKEFMEDLTEKYKTIKAEESAAKDDKKE